MDLLSIIRHHAEAVSHNIEKIARGCLTQTIHVKRSRRAIAAPHYHPLSRTNAIMTGRTINVEALLSPRERRRGYRKRKRVHQFSTFLALVEVFIIAQLASGHSAFHKRAGGALIAEK